MASSISAANVIKFDSDQDMTFRISDGNYDDMAAVTVKEESLSDDESILNCDSIDDFYEFADTSLPVDGECSGLVKDNVIQVTNVMPKRDSILLNLLADSTQKSYPQMHRGVRTTVNTVSKSKSTLKFNLKENKNEIEKCKQLLKLIRPFKLNRGKEVQVGPQKFWTVKTWVPQLVEPQFKCHTCSKVFEHKGQLKLHEIDHNQFKSCNKSLPRQEVITVKEEILSDDEVLSNDASTNECYNIKGTLLPVNVKCLAIKSPISVHLGSNTSDNGLKAVGISAGSIPNNYHGICNLGKSALGSNSELVKPYFIVNKVGTLNHERRTTNFGSVNMNVEKLMGLQRFKTQPKIARWHGTPSPDHRFKCQECSETFELKSYLLNHELSHDRHRKYMQPPVVDSVKQSHATDLAGSVKKVTQQRKRKPCIAPSSFAMCYLRNQSYRRNYLNSFKVKKRIVRWQQRLKANTASEPMCDTSPEEHNFRCQECSETFELKSRLIMHEISHDWCKRYGLPAAFEHMNPAPPTSCIGSANVNDENEQQSSSSST
jgi:transposase-like protein